MSFISYETSCDMLHQLSISTLGREQVLLSNAIGRVLQADIIAQENSPAYPTSAMDGYAIYGIDQEMGHIELISGDNPAGQALEVEITPGYALKTFTGSLMPKGADTLIPIENVKVEGSTILINQPVDEGFAVRPVGESYRQNEVLISAGTTLGYAEIGVMAGLGMAYVQVVKSPNVAILSTGSEILDLGQCSDNPAQIRSSNNYTLEALAHQNGAKAVQLGVVSDAYDSIQHEMSQALEHNDIVVTTGGVSVGDYDFVKDIIPELGAEVIFKGVTIKPGQHIMIAQKGNKFIVGLPGFAFSSTVTFILYVVPLIKRMLGQHYEPTIVNAVLKGNFTKRTQKTEFTACNIRLHHGEYIADFANKKNGTSAILTNMLGNSALMITTPEDTSKAKGETVKVMLLNP